MKSESPFKWAVPHSHHNVVQGSPPHQIVNLQTDHMKSSREVRIFKHRASESPRRGARSPIVWIALTLFRVTVNTSSNLISLEIENVQPCVKSLPIFRTAFMIRMQYKFWSSKKPFQKKTQQG